MENPRKKEIERVGHSHIIGCVKAVKVFFFSFFLLLFLFRLFPIKQVSLEGILCSITGNLGNLLKNTRLPTTEH